MQKEETSHNAAEVVYVGFWLRFVAVLLDTLLLLLITIPLLIYFYGLEYFDNDAFVVGPADLIINWVLPAVIVIMLWVYTAATPGKMVFRAKIVDARTGGRPSVGQYITRYLGYFLSTIPVGLGYLWVAWDPRKQAWHDKLANTVVIMPLRGKEQPVQFDQASS